MCKCVSQENINELRRNIAKMGRNEGENSYNLNCFNTEKAAKRIVEVLSQEAVPIGAIDFVFENAKKTAYGCTLVTTERTMNPQLLAQRRNEKC